MSDLDKHTKLLREKAAMRLDNALLTEASRVYEINFIEVDGGHNSVLLEAKCMSDAVLFVENTKHAQVYSAKVHEKEKYSETGIRKLSLK